MKRNFVKIGNSHGIVIPTWAMDLLGITAKDSVNLEFQGKKMVLTAYITPLGTQNEVDNSVNADVVNGVDNTVRTPDSTPLLPPIKVVKEKDKKDISRTRKARAPASPPDDDFLTELQQRPLYTNVNVLQEFQKMQGWCEMKKKPASRSRLVNWLNNAVNDAPMDVSSNNRQSTNTPRTNQAMNAAREAIERGAPETRNKI